MEGFQQHGCNCYSSGEALNIECVLPKAWKNMLEWLGRVHADPEYTEEKLKIKEINMDELKDVIAEAEVREGDKVYSAEQEKIQR